MPRPLLATLNIVLLSSGVGAAPAARDAEVGVIAAGASWEQTLAERRKWWSFQPLSDPAVPDGDAWSGHPVDRFLVAGMRGKGLTPAPPADPRALFRRLSFALTGLPPQAADSNAFAVEAGHSPDRAFHHAVERFLASPHFGEHWARHWMDVVRYSDTHGSEHDLWNPWVWRYRDYLIRAFNADVPYDRFVREHVAGDLIKPRLNPELALNESPIGTAMHRLVEFYDTPVDPKREEIVVIENQIDALGKAFQGLTLSCARCHDHKFDPISAADFYALYGIFAGSRATMHIVDDPAVLCASDAELRRLRGEIRRTLAAQWRGELRSWPAELRGRLQEKNGPLGPLRQLAQASDAAFPALWSELKQAQTALPKLPPGALVFADFSNGALGGWRINGPGLPAAPAKPGFPGFSSGPADRVVAAIQPAGFYSDTNSSRHGGVLSSPDFVIERKFISVLASGSGGARARVVVENFQGERLLFAQAHPELKSPSPEWVTMAMRDNWTGRRAYIEFVTGDDRPFVDVQKDPVAALGKGDGHSSFGVVQVVFHDGEALPARSELPERLWAGEPAMWNDVVVSLDRLTREALEAWADDRATDSDAGLLDGLLRAGVLSGAFTAGSDGARLVADFRSLERSIPRATRVPGLRDDGFARDHPLFPRGDHTLAGAPVARRWIEVLGGAPAAAGTSGRLMLAHELSRPENPLTARVMANRVWHWLFGRGIVGTPDNFGRLGEAPSHPELLDHLASRFIADGWSVKKLVRYLVTSRAWQMSSQASPRALDIDPANALLSHAPVRRLEAESIRDSLLALAGSLDPSLFGPGIPVHYQTLVDTENQPPPGPLDGRGRRSIYLEVRRKFPNEFLSVFDFPRPSGPAGRRDETNVPAQSLALLNDPFVDHQAGKWARRISAENDADPARRVERMFVAALGRPPDADELRRAVAFLEPTGDESAANESAEPDRWRDLAHAIFNLKEFIYVR